MKAGWPAATARRIGLRGEIDFTVSRVGMTLHVPCARGHSHDVLVEPGAHPDQVAKKMLSKGWTFGRHLLCPDHRRNERIKPAKPKSPKQGETIAMPAEANGHGSTAAPAAIKPEPSDAARKAKRLIYQALEDYYDDTKKAYRPGWSDVKIARELDVSPEFVRTIREESFGPISAPPELADLMAEAATIRADFAEYAKVADERFAAIHRKISDLCQRNGWQPAL